MTHFISFIIVCHDKNRFYLSLECYRQFQGFKRNFYRLDVSCLIRCQISLSLRLTGMSSHELILTPFHAVWCENLIIGYRFACVSVLMIFTSSFISALHTNIAKNDNMVNQSCLLLKVYIFCPTNLCAQLFMVWLGKEKFISEKHYHNKHENNSRFIFLRHIQTWIRSKVIIKTKKKHLLWIIHVYAFVSSRRVSYRFLCTLFLFFF